MAGQNHLHWLLAAFVRYQLEAHQTKVLSSKIDMVNPHFPVKSSYLRRVCTNTFHPTRYDRHDYRNSILEGPIAKSSRRL
jgi:hypothetical protein